MSEYSPDIDRPGIARIDGHRLSLRLVSPDDAEYIHALRTNPLYKTHLSTVTGTADDQRAWIELYKQREAAGQEYYYVIERRDGLRCGVVRLYDIAEGQFTWGSWILDENKPMKAALESAVLSFSIAFDRLGLVLGLIDVRQGNERAIAFYRRFGMVEILQDDQNVYFQLERDQFDRVHQKHNDSIGLQE